MFIIPCVNVPVLYFPSSDDKFPSLSCRVLCVVLYLQKLQNILKVSQQIFPSRFLSIVLELIGMLSKSLGQIIWVSAAMHMLFNLELVESASNAA